MKATLATLDGLTDALKAEYELKDGKYVLKVEGELPGLVTATELATANQKLTEFRNNNVGLLKDKADLEAKVTEFTTKFKDVDPAEHVKLKDKIAELEKKGVKGSDDVNVVVQRAVEAAVGPVQQRLQEVLDREAASAEREAQARKELAQKSTESELAAAGMKLGVDEKAVHDYVRRGLEVWKTVDGKLVAMKGDTPLFSAKKPAEPLGLDEWVQGLMEEAPYFFKKSGGGGAAPATQSGPKKQISALDPLEIGRHAEAIAKGEAVVV